VTADAASPNVLTTWYRLDPPSCDSASTPAPDDRLVQACDADLQWVAQCSGERLKQGQLVAFPTETVYGLGASICCEDALARVFAVKGRPTDNPLIAHIASLHQLELLASRVPDVAHTLMTAYWPGPLTLILPAATGLSPLLTAGLPTVGVRMPASHVARAIIAHADSPIAAPSANRSGRPSPTTAQHVLDDLAGRIDAVVDAGACAVGVESTVVAIDEDQRTLTVLRPGSITRADLTAACGWAVAQFSGTAARPQSPGQKYRHYAPAGRLEIVAGDSETAVCKAMADCIRAQRVKDGMAANGLSVADCTQRSDIAVLTISRAVARAAQDWPCTVYDLGDSDPALGRGQTVAAQLYAALRACDAALTRLIIVEYPPDQPEYEAVRDRLRRAAGGRVTSVP
jgi:L-threonylcarbamoyladenylate synthase